MKRHIFIIFFIVTSIQLFGQNKSIYFDTLSIDVNERIKVKISSYENGWLKYQEGIHTRIDMFKGDLVKIQNQLPENCALKLTSKSIGEISVENIGDIKIYKIADTIGFSRLNEICIYSDNYDILIYFHEINDFLFSDIQKCVNKVIDWEAKHLSEGGFVDYEKGKYHGIAWTMKYMCNNDTITMIPEESHYNANKSMLELSPGIGLGVIQDDIVSDFSFRIGRYGTHKGILKRHQYVSYSLLYNFNQDNNFDINQFINFGYRFNLSNTLNNYRWMGFEIGYLINKKGDFFKSPTFKLGTMIDLSNNVRLTPTIIFDEGFKKIYPGLRLGIDIGL